MRYCRQREIVVNKGRERFIFRYEEGKEGELLDAIIEQVKSGRTSFDWFDAALISFKLRQTLISQAERILHE